MKLLDYPPQLGPTAIPALLELLLLPPLLQFLAEDRSGGPEASSDFLEVSPRRFLRL